MRFIFLQLIGFSVFFSVAAQTVSTDPALPAPSEPVTITFDVTGTDFAAKNLNDVWLWAWLENGDNDTNAPTNVNPATAAQDAAKVTRSSSNPSLYSITLTATTFFGRPASEINTVGVLLKGRAWSDGQTADKFITFTVQFAISFASPASEEFFVNEGESIDISVNTNQPSTIVLQKGSDIIASSADGVTEFSYSHTVSEMAGLTAITAEADNGSATVSKSFSYVVRTPTILQARPAGVVDGINYLSDPSTAILSLWAPGKSSVYVLGDFNNWTIDPAYQMKRDGEHFWLELNGLTPGTEYAFQYLVDENLKIADPYAEKILDPDDEYIPASTYPDLKDFPAAALSREWYFNRLAVLQTGQEPYPWVVNDFQKPAKETLVIYELLVRDFFSPGERSFENLTDTLQYLKRLGVNAIQLMPVMEFNGNESWGYNPTFMFGPDKAYGTKNAFKEFVDACHQNGIAVILDITMNHHDMPNPYVMLDFDFVNGKPEADNKWFNVDARHPFNVFFDMNHESSYTQAYLDTVNRYWLQEFKVDGFRFDLSKGFTQTNNPDNVGAWSAYDASRIDLLKRMADKIWTHSPDAIIILEHFADNAEEKVLAEYRADEGKGMLLWGKMTDPYNQLTMGYADGSDISAIHHESRGWSVPHLVGYMESHDEERLMVKNLLYGNATASYSVKDTVTALTRMRAASTLFLTVPGPKMLWQFGELGYDYSINHCTDGSIDPGCRLSPKPVRWNYREDIHRRRLYDHIRDLTGLRAAYDVFTSGTVTFSADNSLVKQLILKNDPYTQSPVTAEDMNAVVVGNFDIVEREISVSFPHPGVWYDYFLNAHVVNVSGASAAMTLPPGGYKIFTDVALGAPLVTAVEKSKANNIYLYPNPVEERLIIASENDPVLEVSLHTLHGLKAPLARFNDGTWDVGAVPAGFFVVEVVTRSRTFRIKMIKK